MGFHNKVDKAGKDELQALNQKIIAFENVY
jgi:hypothetical protein